MIMIISVFFFIEKTCSFVRIFDHFSFTLTFAHRFRFVVLLTFLNCANDTILPRLHESAILWFKHVVFQCMVYVPVSGYTSFALISINLSRRHSETFCYLFLFLLFCSWLFFFSFTFIVILSFYLRFAFCMNGVWRRKKLKLEFQSPDRHLK